MNEIKLSKIEKAVLKKNNSELIIDKCNTSEFVIDVDINHTAEPILYIITAVLSNDYKYLDLINFDEIDDISRKQIELLKTFLIKSKYGVINDKSIRKDLLQFEIKVSDDVEYQVEIHLGNFNYCVCENYDIVAIDSFK